MTAKEAVRKAWEAGRAILAVNAVNLETAQAIVMGAERAQRPVFLMFSHNALRYGGLEELAALGNALRRKAQVPVFLHLDHAEDLDILERALGLGFDSVMLEEGPLEVLKEARKLAGSRPLELEVEVTAKEGRIASPRSLEAIRELVASVRPDWVAADLGTAHKELAHRRLHLDKVAALASLGLPLVLHGGSSADPQDLEKAASLGVAKVNVATRAFAAFTEGVRESLGDQLDPRKYLGPARERMARWVEALLLGPAFDLPGPSAAEGR